MKQRLITYDVLDFEWRRTDGPNDSGCSNSDSHAHATATETDNAECKVDTEIPPIASPRPAVADAPAADDASSSSSTSSSVVTPSPAKRPPPLTLIGGCDISFVEHSDEACAALIVLSYPDMQVQYEDFEMVHMNAPYIPGYLAFREVTHILRLIERLRATKPALIPQVLLVDGNGLLHHRGFGLASHLGVLADIPTIGVAKNLLCVDGLEREKVMQQASEKLKRGGGDFFPLIGDSGREWASCLRSTDNSTNPIFVSVGHRISLPTATQIVQACCEHRIPTPVRLADLKSREIIREYKTHQTQTKRAPLQFTRSASEKEEIAKSHAAHASTESKLCRRDQQTTASDPSAAPVIVPPAPPAIAECDPSDVSASPSQHSRVSRRRESIIPMHYDGDRTPACSVQ